MTPLSPSLLPTLTSGKSQSAFCPPNPSWDCFIFKIPSGLKKMEWGKVWEESEAALTGEGPLGNEFKPAPGIGGGWCPPWGPRAGEELGKGLREGG